MTMTMEMMIDDGDDDDGDFDEDEEIVRMCQEALHLRSSKSFQKLCFHKKDLRDQRKDWCILFVYVIIP